MKIRDSGMPEEAYWESLFDVPQILAKLGVANFNDVAEIGCGYGTFAIPVAKAIHGTLYAFDIDPAMIKRTLNRGVGLPIVAQVRDVMDDGFGVTVDAVLLFNILHCGQPIKLLEHAAKALRDGGQVLVIHWQYRQTPRGPDFGIRPRPEQIIQWGIEAGLQPISGILDLPPWHYGLQFQD